MLRIKLDNITPKNGLSLFLAYRTISKRMHTYTNPTHTYTYKVFV